MQPDTGPSSDYFVVPTLPVTGKALHGPFATPALALMDLLTVVGALNIQIAVIVYPSALAPRGDPRASGVGV